MRLSYFWRKGLWAFTSLGFVGLVTGAFLYLYLESQLPSVDALKTVKLQVPLHIYTQDGKLIQEYGEKKRIPVRYNQVPQMLVHALLATEDQRFFEHPGVDIFGLGRATIKMIKTGTKSQGASTITMQVARNFFLSRKKTFLRKFNEILLAIKIDRELPKEKILELYLNKIYLGNRAYGVGAAAEVYYGKTLSELTLGEIAMIAGLPQAPSTQNPIVNPKAAEKRRNHVLTRLLEEGYINKSQYEQALKEPVKTRLHRTNVDVSAPYVAEMVRQALFEKLGDGAYTRGYQVYTTLDSTLQNAADNSMRSHIERYDRQHGYRGPVNHPGTTEAQTALQKTPSYEGLIPALVTQVNDRSVQIVDKHGQRQQIGWTGLSWARPALRNGWVGRSPNRASDILKSGDIIYYRLDAQHQALLAQVPEVQGALVSLEPHSGAIKALVGGYDFYVSSFNRATQTERQPGSSFKPILYAAALEKGYTLATLINDSPIVVDDPSQANVWRPHNDNRTFNGPMRLKEALVRSRNLVSIRILDDLGFDYAIEFASRFGFDKKAMPRGLSLALGTLSVNPLTMTSAFSVFVNEGKQAPNYFIDRIEDNQGQNVALPELASVCRACLTPNNTLQAKNIIAPDTAFLMYTALQGVVEHGTAAAARVLNRKDIGGKTGTTNEQFDAWFAGVQPNLVSTVWVGFDNPHSLHAYGASLALPVWIDYMRVALAKLPVTELKKPENIVAVQINPQTGNLAQSGQNNKTITEYFREEDIPADDEELSNSQVAAPESANPDQSLF